MSAPNDQWPLYTVTAWAELKAIERAERIVQSWPEWKRNVELFPPSPEVKRGSV